MKREMPGSVIYIALRDVIYCEWLSLLSQQKIKNNTAAINGCFFFFHM